MLMPTTKNVKTVTDMREDALGLLRDTQSNGLIYIFHRSDPKAVMLSLDEFYRFQEMTEDYLDEIDAAKLAKEPRGELVPIPRVMKEYKKKNFGIFSDAAQEALHRAAEERKDIVALVHRRGAYTTVACRECGRVERCANCTLPLIYHERDQQLHCHPCHRTQPLRELCAFCKGPHVAFRGAGTQAVETALREALCDTPYTIHRIDGDTDVPHFNVERPAAVVGTSRALSHVRWGRVGLVCANDIDGFLALPEYRATAEFVGLIRDVQYLMPARATMLLQTREPHRPVLDALGSGMLEPWYREELHLREQLHYPPFWSILKLTHWGASPEESRAAAAFIVAALTRLTAGAKNAILTHPYPTHPPIRKGLYGLIVLLRMPHEQAREQFPALLEQLALPDVWKVDVDPLTLL